MRDLRQQFRQVSRGRAWGSIARQAYVGLAIAVLSWVAFSAEGDSSVVASAARSTRPSAQVHDDFFAAANVVGPRQCLICHASEFGQWAESKHASGAFDLLRTDSMAEYLREELNIADDDLTTTSLCAKCHATPAMNEQGHAEAIQGISCEACHNPAGGESGWLNLHGVYGPGGTPREFETDAHWASRKGAATAAGMNGPSDLYSLARRCFQCHAVGEESIVNLGHSSGTEDFDFAKSMSESIRHNFHVNQGINAPVSSLWLTETHGPAQPRTVKGRMQMMKALGILADLEISLRNLAAVTNVEGDFHDASQSRVARAFTMFQDEVVARLPNPPLEFSDALNAARPIQARLSAGEFELERDRQECLAAAETILRLGSQYARTSNGHELAPLDSPALQEVER